ncbi:hypothetical protein MYG64_26700 (plasmid) [Ensifer adhaerens]|nr:hypothetical protein MYG64_26700 [Ensifer adhaerens]
MSDEFVKTSYLQDASFSDPPDAMVLSLDAGNLRRRAFGNTVDDNAVRALIGEFQAFRIGLDEVLQTGILGLSRLGNGIRNGSIRRVSGCHPPDGKRQAKRDTKAALPHPLLLPD